MARALTKREYEHCPLCGKKGVYATRSTYVLSEIVIIHCRYCQKMTWTWKDNYFGLKHGVSLLERAHGKANTKEATR